MDDLKQRFKSDEHTRVQRRKRVRMIVLSTGKIAVKYRNKKSQKKIIFTRVYAGLFSFLFIVSLIAGVIGPQLEHKPYEIDDKAKTILPKQNEGFSDVLSFNNAEQIFEYNSGYVSGDSSDLSGSGDGTPRIQASFEQSAQPKVTVTDPTDGVQVSLKPKFKTNLGRQDLNQIFYPLKDERSYLVYTTQITGVKEDILVSEYTTDRLEYEYELEMNNGLEAKLDSNGAIYIYGTSLPINGEVSTGTTADAELLEKARQSAPKDKLLFSIPAPVVVEFDKTTSDIKSHFELEGNTLRVVAEDLKNASFPLSIDPSIYVETAQRLMRGNNETNLDFDVTNELIQKSKLTGARFDSWNSTLALPSARYDNATATYGGFIYSVGGNNGSTNTGALNWAKLNTTTGAIEAHNPGAGACSGWCTDSAYDLPETRIGHSMVAYNGYMYVMGGLNGGTRSDKIFIAKLGLNGEPQLWHPTDTNQNNWVYWYSAQTLSNERSYAGAVAYNNRMYFMGGQTNAATGGVTTVEYANINPIGTLSSWTTSGTVALPSVRHNFSTVVYNDRLYLVGGNSSGTLQNSVHYIRINSDGTLAGSSWSSTTPFTTARMTGGGNFATIWGGYIYVAGGCSSLVTGSCNTVSSDFQLASINADGTVSDWTIVDGVTNQRYGYGLVAWRGTLYGIGGCTTLVSSACATVTSSTSYGVINQDGDASTVRSSVASGTSPCDATGGWTNCDLPPAGNGNGQGGRMSGGTIINNGFVYYIGGCYAVGGGNICFAGNAGKASDTISYASIASDGKIVRAATCTGTNKQFSGSWCVDNSNTINGSTGLAGFGYTIFNNTIYVIGGTSGTFWQDIVWRNTVNSDGSLNAWSTQTFSGVGLGDAKGYQYAFTRANPADVGTNPGNLYVLGGCSGPTGPGDNGLNCDGKVFSEVYKCNIATNTTLNGCTTTGQLQIDAEPGTAGVQGLGVMAGAVYANYVYLVGGQSTNESERGQVMYAKIDNSNNIVAVSGSDWITSANTLSPVRRRGVAFGYNGYLYAVAGYTAGTSLNDLLFAKIDTSDGSIGAFKTSGVTVDARWDLRVVVNNGYVYTMAGCSVGQPPSNCTEMTGGVQVFQLYNNYSGSPALYSTSANLFATDRLGHGTAIVNGYIYVAGGCTGLGDCSVTTNNSQFAPIDSVGGIGSWSNTTDSTIPGSRGWGKMVAAGGSLYFIGGETTLVSASSDVYYATPSISTGNISAWSTATNGLPAARTKHAVTVWNDRIYVVGGYNGTAVQSTVYVSPQLSSGGNITSAWSTTTAFNVARSGATAIAYANNLYILGGSSDNGTTMLSDVQFAKIDSDGTVPSGNWQYTSSLPDKLYGADGYAYNGFMYLFGGRSSATVCETNTIAAPISANTTISSGNNPTGIGEWFETNEKYVGSRYGAQASYWEGKAYITGGGCGTTLTYTGANRVVQTTLLAQPQVAKYSRMIDTDTNVFPTKWLMNGLDNSIGARWKVNYRSSTAANAAWGQETNFGAVTLGQPENYIPLDGSGTNTNFARYFYFSINIDSSQAYGYPEDVTRGPTIDDITLFFTSDPSKRLRHGKTFTGGEQQPLDTPF